MVCYAMGRHPYGKKVLYGSPSFEALHFKVETLKKNTRYKQSWMNNKGCVIFSYQKITLIPVIIHFLVIVAGPV